MFADPLDLDENLRRAYQVATFCWGKGSGKDYLCSIVVCWLVHILLCLRDPQAYLESGARRAGRTLSTSPTTPTRRRSVFFAKLKARLERWTWLAERFNIVEGGRRKGTWIPGRLEVTINDEFIEFPRGIRAWSTACAKREL